MQKKVLSIIFFGNKVFDQVRGESSESGESTQVNQVNQAVSVYISRISLALEKSITGYLTTLKMYKVSKCSDVMEFLSLK